MDEPDLPVDGELTLTPLNIAKLLGDSVNINDPVFQQALQTRILCDESLLRTSKNQLIGLAYQQHKNVVNQNVRIPVPFTVSTEDLDVFKMEYGSVFYLDQSKALPNAPHSMCKSLNKIEHYMCLKLLGYDFNDTQNNRPENQASAFAVCVGANSMFYLANNLPFIHSCCPHLNYDDLVRKHLTDHHLEIFRCETEYQKMAKQALLDANNHGLKCNLRSENCDMPSQYCMFIYSSCNMNRENMVAVMENHGAKLAVGVTLFDYKMLLYPTYTHGVLHYHQMYWEINEVRGRLRITFTFRDNKMQKSYDHDFADYMSFIKVGTVHSQRYNGVNYLFTITDVKMEAVYFMIFKNTHSMLGGPTRISVPIGRTFDPEKIVVKSLKMEVLPNGRRVLMPKVYPDIPGDFVYKVIVHLMKARETTFNFKTAFDIGALYNSDIVIGGLQMGVPKENRIPVTDLQWVIFALMAQVYKDNYDVGEANKVFRADIDLARRNEGTLTYRFWSNVYYKFWPWGAPAAWRQFNRITSNTEFDYPYNGIIREDVKAPDEGIILKLWHNLFTVRSRVDVGICRGMGMITMKEYIEDFEGSEMSILDGIPRPPIMFDVDGKKIDNYVKSISVNPTAVLKPLKFERRLVNCLECDLDLEVIHNNSIGSCFYVSMIDAGLTDESIPEIKNRLLYSKHLHSFPKAHVEHFKLCLTDSSILPLVSMMALVAMEYGISVCIHSHDMNVCQVLESGEDIYHFYVSPEHMEAMREKAHLPYVPMFEFDGYDGPEVDLTPYTGNSIDPNQYIKEIIFESGEYSSQILKDAKKDADPLSRLPYYVCRSEHKLLEILHRCNLQMKGVYVGLCEGPGGWVKVAMDAGCEVYANTFNDVSKGGIPFAYSKFDKQLHVLRGHYATSDGDITVLQNQDAIIKDIRRLYPAGVDFVTADGMPGMGEKYIDSLRNILFLSEMKIALNILKIDGTFILKLCDIHDRLTMAFVSILLKSFLNVKILRPASSKPFSGEVFVVCVGFSQEGFESVSDTLCTLGTNIMVTTGLKITKRNLEIMKECILVLNTMQQDGLMLLKNCCDDRKANPELEAVHSYSYSKHLLDMFKRVCTVMESGKHVTHRDIIHNPSIKEFETVRNVGGMFSFDSITEETEDVTTKADCIILFYSDNDVFLPLSGDIAKRLAFVYDRAFQNGRVDHYMRNTTSSVLVAHINHETLYKVFDTIDELAIKRNIQVLAVPQEELYAHLLTSVIFPLHKTYVFVPRCVDEVKSQSYKSCESLQDVEEESEVEVDEPLSDKLYVFVKHHGIVDQNRVYAQNHSMLPWYDSLDIFGMHVNVIDYQAYAVLYLDERSFEIPIEQMLQFVYLESITEIEVHASLDDIMEIKKVIDNAKMLEPLHISFRPYPDKREMVKAFDKIVIPSFNHLFNDTVNSAWKVLKSLANVSSFVIKRRFANYILKTSYAYKFVATPIAEYSLDMSSKLSARKPRDVSAWFTKPEPLVRIVNDGPDIEDEVVIVRSPVSDRERKRVRDAKPKMKINENDKNIFPDFAKPTDVVPFYGPNNLYSNMHECSIKVDGNQFSSVEAAYQYCKAKYHNQIHLADKIIGANGMKAKSLTKSINLSKEWYDDRLDILVAMVYQKFKDHPIPKGIYVETSSDTYWGSGLTYMDENNRIPTKWVGKNMMGKILTVMSNDKRTGVETEDEYNQIKRALAKAKHFDGRFTTLIKKTIVPHVVSLTDEDLEYINHAMNESREIVVENDLVQLQNHIAYAQTYRNTSSRDAFLLALKDNDENLGVCVNSDGTGVRWKYKPIVPQKYRTYFDIEKQEFVVDYVARSTRGVYIASNYTMINYGAVIADTMLKNSGRFKTNTKMALIAAAFGTGKTEYVISNAISNVDGVLQSKIMNADGSKRTFAILTATSGSRQNLIDRVKEKYGYFDPEQEKTCFRTFDSLFIHGTRLGDDKVDDLWIDEALMAHCGEVFHAATMYDSSAIYCLGDFLQVPYLCRVPAFNVRFSNLLNVGRITETLSICYRCPLDVVAVWRELYKDFSEKFGKAMILRGANQVRRSMTMRRVSSLEKVKRRFDVQYITMNQSEKKTLCAWLFHGMSVQQRKAAEALMTSNKVRKPCTVHEYQGSQHKHVILIRTETKDAYPIFRKGGSDYGHNPHVLVATTRHSETFEYITLSSVDDGITAIVKAATETSESDIMNIYYGCVGRVEIDTMAGRRVITKTQLSRTPVGTLSYKVKECYGYWSRMIFESYNGMRVVKTNRFFLVNMPHDFFRAPRATQKELLRAAAPQIPKDIEIRVDVTKAVERGYTEMLSDIFYSTLKSNKVVYKCYSSIKEKTIPMNLVRAEYTEINSSLPNDDILVTFPATEEIIYEPDNEKPDLSILQNFLNEEFGPTEYSGQLITDAYNSADLVFDFEGMMRVNTSKFGTSTRRFANMTPRLRGPMPGKKPRTLQETLYAFQKRNGAVPKLQMEVSYWKTSDDMLVRFFESYIDKERFGQINQESIRFSADDLLLAASNQKEEAVRNLEFCDMLYHKPGNRVSYEIKRTAKPPDTVDDLNKYPAPQTIVYPSKEVNLSFCVIWREIRERLTASLKDNTFIYSQMSPDEFARVLSKAVPPKMTKGLKRLELDMAKYDKSQGFLALLFETKMMRMFKVPEYYVTLWWNTHLITLLKDPVTYFRSRIYLQRRSGDASTFLGNTAYLMACIACVYDIKDNVLNLFSGDDSVLIGPNFADLSAKMAALFNLEVKFVDKFTCIYFCSKFLLELDENTWVFVPNPRKLAVKLSRTDMVNPKHVEFYHISFADHVKCYGNTEVQIKLDYAYRERYGRVSPIIDVIKTLHRLADFKSFSELYYVAAGDIIDEQRYIFNIER